MVRLAALLVKQQAAVPEDRPRSWLYPRLLGEAFPGAWAACWISSTIATIIGACIAVFVPMPNQTTAVLVGVVPLLIFAALMVGGPLLAACRIIRDQERQLADKATRTQMMALIALTISELNGHRELHPGGNFNEWDDRYRQIRDSIRDQTGTTFTPSVATMILSARRDLDPSVVSNVGREHLKKLGEIDAMMDALRELEKRIAAPHR